MSLAAILGICVLSSWPFSMPAAAVWQSTSAQESQPSSSRQDSAAPTDQQKAVQQPSVAPQPPAPAVAPCPENSQTGSKSDCKPTSSTGTKTTKKHHHKTVAPAGTPAGPTKTVVRNGGEADPTVELSPGLSPQQASHQTQSTKELLATSDANLKTLAGRQLSPSQEETVKQIKSYMEQAKAAEDDGEVQRAHNLAVKANLLSADLVGH